MSSGVPKKVDSLIYDQLNESTKNNTVIPDLQLQELINQAKTLEPVIQHACLAALYSHAFKFKLAKDNAIKAIAYSKGEPIHIGNAVAALMNLNLYKEVVEISKKKPFILEYIETRSDVYDAAIYTLDLEYCDMIAQKYGYPDVLKIDHRDYLEFFNSEQELLVKGGQYLTFALESLIEVLKVNSVRRDSLMFELVHSDNDSFLALIINFKKLSIDKIIDMEDEWHSRIAKFLVDDDKLCNISFTMRDDS